MAKEGNEETKIGQRAEKLPVQIPPRAEIVIVCHVALPQPEMEDL
jgi:hypothetical protein